MAISDLVYIDATGYHFPDYPTILNYIQTGYQGIYGSDIVITPDSQDGQFLAFIAQAIFDAASFGSSTYNSFSPVTAQGVGLSRNVKINGLNRENPTFSTAILTIVGVAGTVITKGIAQDTLQQNWVLPSPTTIPMGGSINVTATAQTVGAINAAANTITTIFTPTLGWQTVNNAAAAATPGAPIEEDGTLRARQIKSTANPSLTVLEGTYGAVANVAGVTNAAVWENDTGSDDANSQPAHSILVVVEGGTLSDIGQAIQIHKTPGTYPWSGPTNAGHNQSEIVYDSRGMPITIGFFQPPLAAEIGVQVTLTPGVGWTTDFETTIAAQISAYINSLGIGAGAQNGGYVRLIPLYSLCYVPSYVPTMYVIDSIEIQINAGGFGSSNIPISYVQLPSCSATPGVDVVFVT